MDITRNLPTTYATINNVGIIYDKPCMYAKLMIQEYYSGPEYDGTVYLLTPANGFDYNLSRPLNREVIRNWFGHDFKHIVFWNFDHLKWDKYVAILNKYLEDLQPDEIWEWQYENVINGRYSLQDRVKFVPLRYVSMYERLCIDKYQEQTSVCHFIGNLTERRSRLFSEFSFNFLNFKILCGVPIYNRIDEISRSGFSLNVHGEEGNYREQLRISENICLGIPVAMEYDDHNYYPGLTVQFDYNWALNDPRSFLSWLGPQYDLYKFSDLANEYKRMTHTEEAYDTYKLNIIKTY